MAIYLVMTVTASYLLRLLEKKMDGDSSYELVQVDSLTMTAGTYSHPDKGSPFDEENKERRHAKKELMKARNSSARGER